MKIPSIPAQPLWECVLRGEMMMQEYFAEPTTLQGALLMTCRHDETFNLAMIDDVPSWAADDVLQAIIEHYRQRNATPRVRLSPFSTSDWQVRLAAAGFVEVGERRRFWVAPRMIGISTLPGLTVTRVTRPEEADRVSAIQAAGFALSPDVHEWERQLARQRLAEGSVRFYLGRLNGRAVGTGSVMPLANGALGLWGLTTLSTARDQGVALAVLGQMIADGHAIGTGPVFFTTSWDNQFGIVYERFGCVPLFRTRLFEYRR